MYTHTSLGNLEKEVLNFLWERKKATVKEVYEHFQDKRKLAYTTIFTVLQRLISKGLVKRDKSLYSPSCPKDVFIKRIFKNFFDNLFSDFGDVALSSFAEGVKDLPSKERKKLIRKLEEVLKNER